MPLLWRLREFSRRDTVARNAGVRDERRRDLRRRGDLRVDRLPLPRRALRPGVPVVGSGVLPAGANGGKLRVCLFGLLGAWGV